MWRFDAGQLTGLDPEPVQHLKWDIFPNPAGSLLNFQRVGCQNPESAGLLFLDITGQLQFQIPFAETVSTTGMSPGLYFILLEDGPHTEFIGKAVIQK
ncbi:MAG TPA: T9SS type A sorting domain-containing protein [Flavilitoribacter sp.]|nr:T9SS type A sorting domain-containing protein [Flavilitoribacter sp.]